MAKRLALIVASALLVSPAWAQMELAPGATLRAAYLATNPTQAVRNPQTGEMSGASYDLARELAKRVGKPLDFNPEPSPPAVIEAVKSGRADIGLVAYEATRVGAVEFSQTYMVAHQTFLVLDGSGIKTIADIDQPGRKIGGTRADSITLCLKRLLKQATPVELDNDPAGLVQALQSGQIDALGANRQRLTTLMRNLPGSRLLSDNLFLVPQNIVVPTGKPEALAAVNGFIDDTRSSGFLGEAVSKSRIVGLDAAPAAPVSRFGCPA